MFFLFVTAIISLAVTSIVMYIICSDTKLKSLVTSLALQQIWEVGAVAKQEHVSVMHGVECTCKTEWYTIFMLSLAVLGIIIFIIFQCELCSIFCKTEYFFSVTQAFAISTNMASSGVKENVILCKLNT